jgi:hypothetical protein
LPRGTRFVEIFEFSGIKMVAIGEMGPALRANNRE